MLGPHRWISAAFLVAAMALCPRQAAAEVSDSSHTSPDLRSATARPWNPPKPVPAAETWESALRLPGRLVSLPLVALGIGARRGVAYVEETATIERVSVVLASEGALGIAVVPASLGDGTGVGGEVRWSPPRLAHHLLASLSASTRQYNRESVSASAGPLRATYTSDCRPREPYFGLGLGTPHSGESAYGERTQSARLVASWEWPRVEPASQQITLQSSPGLATSPMLTQRTQLGAWAGPREALLTRGHDPDRPSIELAHAADAAEVLDRRVEHFVYGAGFSHDARAGRPHWSRGWRASIASERYDKSIAALAIRDAHSDARTFTRVTYRAEGGASFGRDPRTLRLALKMVDQQIDQGGGRFLLRDLATLGGSDLAGFEPGRFRDVDLVVGKLTYIYPLALSLEFDLHAESGGVFPNLGRVRPSTFKNSFGAALRFRVDQVMLGAVGIDWSFEGMRLRFSLGGVE